VAKINQDLISRLSYKLGLNERSIYPRIQRVVNETGLERHLAALLLAMRNDINVNRFSTPDERADVSTFLGAAQRRAAGFDGPKIVVERAVPARRAASKKSTPKKKVKPNTIFVVHGRDEPLRRSMFEFLRALGQNPQEWQQALAAAKGNNPYVGAVIDEVMEQAQAVVVMLSPDDAVTLKEQFWSASDGSNEKKPQGQARPNVLFEAGMAMAAHSKKTILVRFGKVKHFSDVFGRHIPSLGDDFDSRNDFANRLEKAGCTVNRTGTDWTRAGTLVPTEPKPAKKPKVTIGRRKAG
jgi:predicted nucleotide-binding protein